MALEVFKLFGSIMVNNEEANKSISKTEEKAEGLGSKFVKGVGTAAKWGAGIVGAAGAGATALFGMANKAAESTDRIDKLSAKIGISKTSFQEWDYVLAQNGMDVDKLQVGVKTLTSKMDAAASGNKSAMESFDALGLSWEDGTGKLKSQEEMMNEAIMALANMENGTEKAKLATELFGKAGIEMMPMLNNGAQGITDLKDRAHDLGLVMNDEAVTAGVVLGDTMADVKNSFGAVVTKIGVEVMPIIQTLCEFILNNMPIIQQVFSIVFNVIETGVKFVGEVIGNILNFVSEQLEGTGLTWDTVWNACKSIFDTFINALKLIWDSIGKPMFDLIISITGIVKDAFAEYMPMMKEFFSSFVNDCKSLWDNNLKPMFDAIKNLIENVLAPAFKLVFETIIGPSVGSAFKFIIDMWNNSLKPILTGIIDFISGVFSGNWSNAWDGLVSIVKGVFGGLVNVVKAPLNLVIGMINKMIGGLNKIKMPDWVPGIGGKGINIPNIPLLAKGTDYFRGGMAIVGEQGPELISMPRGSKVNTADETRNMLGGIKEVIVPVMLNGIEIARAIASESDIIQGRSNQLSLRRAGV